jgi:hypothetical protein
MSEIRERPRSAEADPKADDEEVETPPKTPRDERERARAQAAEYLY